MAMEELLPYQFEPEYSDREDLDNDDDDDDSHALVSRPYSCAGNRQGTNYR